MAVATWWHSASAPSAPSAISTARTRSSRRPISRRSTLAGIEEQFGIDFRDYFAASLAKLEQAERDGLVVTREDRLQITATGAMLLRIVAMAFDAYLDGGKRAVAAAARYSRVL